MAVYLLVRDSDGTILARFDSAGSARRVLERFRAEELPLRGLSVVRGEDGPGRRTPVMVAGPPTPTSAGEL
jgi:hypothetical protein